MRLSWLFVILPIVEIALFIQVGGLIGLFPTLALVVLSAAAGIWVMRMQGANAMMRLQRSLQEFGDPAAPMAHGALIMLGGALLVIPGFFTDFLGILLLIAPVRQALLKKLGANMRSRGASFGYSSRGPGADYPREETIIDGEYVVEDDPPPPVREGLPDGRGKPGNSGWTRH